MDFGWSDDDIEFRQSLHSFAEAELHGVWSGPVRHLGSPANVAYSKHFCGELARRGWLTPHWPAEHGGREMTPWQHIVLGEELWSIGEPRGPQYMNVNWIGPSIMAHGSADQKRMHLPPIARGDVIWCQGFSEPDAGSALASLRTKADRDGAEYVVNGQKIWTSYASVANFCYLLVRTDPESRGHRGISVLLVPTGTPGFEMRPVRSVVGEHAFHELFFHDMRVPEACRLGPENEGWAVVREALAFERVGAPRYARAARVLDDAMAWAAEHGRSIPARSRERAAQARAACEAARLLAYRVIDERAHKQPPTPNVYLARAAMVHAERLVGQVVTELLGSDALEQGSIADEQLRKALAAGLAGGSYEMQLNLIARLKLNLPKA
ncbi:MAG: acyl-CoA dehydrogenase family protein [Acidimicrobiales bacterium]